MGKTDDKQIIVYEVDPYNRLIFSTSGKKSGLSRFRQVIDGRFKIDKDNRLSYHVKTPTPKGVKVPHQLKIDGVWSLDENHDLCLSLNKWGKETFGDKLTLRGEIIDVSKNSLAFSIVTYTEEDMYSIYILQLKGRWQADKNNQLNFLVQKEHGRHDILNFKGSWKLNAKNEIIYQYKKTELIRKERAVHTLRFKGYWDIKNKGRLYYVLDQDSDSVFSFKTTAAVYKKNKIKYELGIGRQGTERTINISGRWKIKKDIGLVFAVEYGDKKVHDITFGAEAKLNKRDSISFELKNRDNKWLGAQIDLSRKTLKGDGLSFLRLLKSKEESTITLGAGFSW